MYQITQKLASKASSRYCIFWISVTVHNLGVFWSFLSEKGVKSAPNWPQLLAVWLLNGLKFVPKGPKMTPKQPQQYSIVVVSTTVHYLGAFRSFLVEESVETSPKLLIWITYVAWFLNFEQP